LSAAIYNPCVQLPEMLVLMWKRFKLHLCNYCSRL
jgi:hypothetical protein